MTGMPLVTALAGLVLVVGALLMLAGREIRDRRGLAAAKRLHSIGSRSDPAVSV